MAVRPLNLRSLLLCSLVTALDPGPAAGAPLDWQRLPPLPDREGFAGVSRGVLLVAGAADFP